MLQRFVIPERKLMSMIFKYKQQNIKPIIDYPIEYHTNIFTFFEKYINVLHAYPNNFHAIKLSGIGMNTSLLDAIMRTCAYTENKLIIDGGDANLQENISKLTNNCVNLKTCHVFKTYQVYDKNVLNEIKKDIVFF